MRGLSLLTIGTLLTAMLVATPHAEAKSPFEGKGKTPELKMSGDAEEIAGQKAEEAQQVREQKMKQEKKKLKGLEKQQTKKSEQVQKELGKGSEKGKAMRTEKRKKWWKFGLGKDDETVPEVE